MQLRDSKLRCSEKQWEEMLQSSVSSASQKPASMPNSGLLNLCSLDGLSIEEGLSPDLVFTEAQQCHYAGLCMFVGQLQTQRLADTPSG